MSSKRYILSDNQVKGLVKLIDNEIELNNKSGDEAYNPYWEKIKMELGYAITR